MTTLMTYRNPEKKKERSRFAARCRRNKEAEIFGELSEMLPLPPKTLSLLDKASIMRLTISYLKMAKLLKHYPSPSAKAVEAHPIDQAFLRSLEGFLLVLSGEGDMVYLSKNVDQYLGLNQIDMIGHSIFEFSHPCEHDEIREMLLPKDEGSAVDGLVAAPLARPFLLRMKCTLNKKGKHVNLKSAMYKVIHFTGKYVSLDRSAGDFNQQTASGNRHCLVTVGEPIPHPANVEVPLDKQIILTQHGLNMKFTYVDERMQKTLGFSKEEMLGQSPYEFYHSYDSEPVIQCFKSLLQKGQCQTGRYRFLAKHGGHVWLVTQATVIYSNKSQKPQYIVCINYILSGIEDADSIVSSKQLPAVELTRPESSIITAPTNATSSSSDKNISRDKDREDEEFPSYCSPVPFPCTAKIFAPRTEDMNKGYLMFTNDKDGMTVMNEEPEDLTHLAPTAGDDCIPLDFDSSGGMFDDVLFPENVYESPPMSEYMSPVCEEQTKLIKVMNQSTILANDPFLSYRDQWLTSSGFKGSQDDISGRSVSVGSIDLQRSQSSSSPPQLEFHDEDADQFTGDLKIPMMDRIARLLLEKRSEFDDTDDLVSKANYIPVGAGDFLPLTPSSSSSCDSLDFQSNSDSKRFRAESSLARLLQADAQDMSARRHIRHVLAQRMDSQQQELKVVETKKKTMLDIIKGLNDLGSPDGTYFDSGGTTFPLPKQEGERQLKELCNKSASHQPAADGDGKRQRTLKSSSQISSVDLKRCSIHQHEGSGVSAKRARFQQESLDKAEESNEPSNSVLLNLLICGQDVSHGYTCVKNPEIDKKVDMDSWERLPPALRSANAYQADDDYCKSDVVIHKANNHMLSPDSLSLLDSDVPSLASLLKLTQHDTEVNAPVKQSHGLLQGQDLLNALDQSMSGNEDLI